MIGLNWACKKDGRGYKSTWMTRIWIKELIRKHDLGICVGI